MKKLAVLLAVVCLLALAGVGQAADLQAGSYANVSDVHIYYPDAYGNPTGAASYLFSTPPGDYGPLLLTEGLYNDNRSRAVSVVSNVTVEPGVLLDMPVSTTFVSVPIAYVSFFWQTNYDASEMYLELVRSDSNTGQLDVLWQQTQSGAKMAVSQAGYGLSRLDGLSFRVVAVPEPPGILCLLFPISAMVLKLRTRRCKL